MKVSFILSPALAKCAKKTEGGAIKCQMELPENTDIRSAMALMNIPKHIPKVISKNGEVIHSSHVLSDGEEIKIVALSHGG